MEIPTSIRRFVPVVLWSRVTSGTAPKDVKVGVFTAEHTEPLHSPGPTEALVAALGTLEIALSFGTSSEVLIAKKYVVLALNPVTVNDSPLPATCGEGSPLAWKAEPQLPAVIVLVE